MWVFFQHIRFPPINYHRPKEPYTSERVPFLSFSAASSEIIQKHDENNSDIHD